MTTAGFLSYQWELREAVRVSPVTVVEKSRRTGYSWAAGAIGVEHAARCREDGGMDVYYMGYNLEMAREYIEYCGDWARVMQVGAVSVGETVFKDPERPDQDIKAFRMDTSAGKIVALPSVPRALRGMQGLVIIDEAAFHDDLEELLKAAFALLIWGGKVLVISTHDGDENPFNTLITDIRAGRKPYSLLRCDFDRALSEGLYKRICQKQGKQWTAEAETKWRNEIIAFYGDGADEELFCIPNRGNGAYLPLALLEKRSDSNIPVVRWEQPDAFVEWPEHLRVAEAKDWCDEVLAPLLSQCDPKLQHYFGQDFARNGDLTDLWPLSMQQNMVRRPPFVLELRNIPFDQQRQVLWYVLDRLPRFMGGMMDATGNGAHLAEITAQRYGMNRITQVKFSEAWYRDNMPRWKAAFEDGTVMLPRDADIISDHRAIKLVKGVARVPEGDTSGGRGKGRRHGDSAIAHVLAHAASCTDIVEYAYEPALPAAAASGHDDDADGAWGVSRARFGKGAW
jgi:phage FluMu gp28-like protein